MFSLNARTANLWPLCPLPALSPWFSKKWLNESRSEVTLWESQGGVKVGVIKEKGEGETNRSRHLCSPGPGLGDDGPEDRGTGMAADRKDSLQPGARLLLILALASPR